MSFAGLGHPARGAGDGALPGTLGGVVATLASGETPLRRSCHSLPCRSACCVTGGSATRPLPPPEQQAAIGRLGYGAGVLGKIYLRFPHQFWPDKSKWFGRLPDAPDRRGTFNTFVSHVEETGLPILLSFANGHSAVRYDRELDDEEVKQAALGSLRKMFGHNKVPEPEAFVFPRWLSDPWTMGGYSYPAIGSPPEDHADHARPLGNRVFFAGEATEPVEYGTVHAALWSAEQTAGSPVPRRHRRRRLARHAAVGRGAAGSGPAQWLKWGEESL